MPVYDAELRRMVVRVVYDGPGFAGKTTNLQKLQDFFTTQRRGELVVPDSHEGRTLWFDWMHLDGGLVLGHRLRCQLVTVPGQSELAHRRAHLLATADVVVFVVEGTAAGAEAARPMFESLPSSAPVVLQVNKQDIGGAIGPSTIAALLGAPEDQPMVGAAASEGVGVRETLVLAIRCAASGVQARVLEEGLAPLEGTSQTPDELLAEMQRLADSTAELLEVRTSAHPSSAAVLPSRATPIAWPESEHGMASETALVETSGQGMASDAPNSVLESVGRRVVECEPAIAPLPASDPVRTADSVRALGVDSALLADSVSVLTPTPDSKPAFEPEPEPAPAPELELASASEPEAMAESASVPEPVPDFVAAFVPVPVPNSALVSESTTVAEAHPRLQVSSQPPPAIAAESYGPPELDERRSREHHLGVGLDELEPPFPMADVPSGFIWPASPGRSILRAVGTLGRPERVSDRTGRAGLEDGSGGDDLLLFKAGAWCLKTSRKRRFTDVEEARAALLALARAKRQIAELLPPDTVLSLERAGDGALWLWTVCPWLLTARAEMTAAVREADERRLGDALIAYATAALESATLALARCAALDIHPSNFARYRDSRLYYIDDDIERARQLPALGHALLHRVQEYEAFPGAVEQYVAFVERELATRFDRAEAERIGLFEALGAGTARTSAQSDARDRWRISLSVRRGGRV